MQFFSSNVDLFIFTGSCLILLVFLLKYLQSKRNNSEDDDDNGDGGQLNPTSDPILDLPPGVTLPKESTKPELV